MAQPVLVKAYSSSRSSSDRIPAPGNVHNAKALPPVSAYAFADILRSADSQEFQNAIDGIAEIAAKNRMSLADEYASHLPPLGEITAATTTNVRPHLLRPNMRTALTSVPEGSSGSSEGSRKSKKKGSIFSFRRQHVQDSKPMRRMRIGSMGRTIPVGITTALAAEAFLQPQHTRSSSGSTVTVVASPRPRSPRRATSAAETSLQQLLRTSRVSREG